MLLTSLLVTYNEHASRDAALTVALAAPALLAVAADAMVRRARGPSRAPADPVPPTTDRAAGSVAGRS